MTTGDGCPGSKRTDAMRTHDYDLHRIGRTDVKMTLIAILGYAAVCGILIAMI
jgi:hypothetical protein